ncbi:hypothetical protein V8G54_007851 [Vigna mungo]|uniref:Uncharacterized protein n=1 Tax=Vigna mungo TaxID=3915 RepID=A0AAQ3S5V1_VIGMU
MAFFSPPYSSLLFSTYSLASAAISFTNSKRLSSDNINLSMSNVNSFPCSLIFLTCSSRKGTRSILASIYSSFFICNKMNFCLNIQNSNRRLCVNNIKPLLNKYYLRIKIRIKYVFSSYTLGRFWI